MKEKLKYHFNTEMDKAKSLIKVKEFDCAFSHLERAHVLGQKYVIPHTVSHWYMLKIGWKKRDLKEILGQLIRLPLGLVGSFVGIVPTGNTGGSNVSAFIKMDIPQEFLELLEDRVER